MIVMPSAVGYSLREIRDFGSEDIMILSFSVLNVVGLLRDFLKHQIYQINFTSPVCCYNNACIETFLRLYLLTVFVFVICF